MNCLEVYDKFVPDYRQYGTFQDIFFQPGIQEYTASYDDSMGDEC